jgi:hypothetical protein
MHVDFHNVNVVHTPLTVINLDYDLPPVSQQKRSGGMLGSDYDILKAASNDLFKKDKKKDTYDPYADEPDFDPWNKQKESEEKSMRELMKEKMEKMSDVESVEDRKARLRAQRDLIVQQKKKEMHEELKDAREGKTDNKYSNNLFKDLMALDKKVSQQEEQKKRSTRPKKDDSPEIKPQEDDEAQPMPGKAPKKDMKSLFDSDDEDTEEKKKQEELARRERARQVMKQAAEEGKTSG